MDDKINLAAKLATFSDYWSPRTVAQLNNFDVMVVKVMVEFGWHKHDDTDDFFLVLDGTLDIQMRDRVVTLGPGEMYIVPKGCRALSQNQDGRASVANRAKGYAEHW